MEGWSREQGEKTSYTKNIMSHNVPRLSRDLHLSCTNLRQRAGTLPGLFFFFHFRHKAKWSALKSCCDQNKKKRNNGNVARRTSEFIRRRESTD